MRKEKKLSFVLLVVFTLFLSLLPSASIDAEVGLSVVAAEMERFYDTEAFSVFHDSYHVIADRSIVSIAETMVDINEGETVSLHATCTYPGATIQWISNNTSVATVNSSGVVTAIKAYHSQMYITAYVLINNNLYLANCPVYVKIPDGVYYVKNKCTGLHANATQYYSGSEVLQWSLHGGTNQRWAINYISDGEYSITNGMSGRYLGVESLNSTSAETTQYSVLNDKTKWKISKTSSGAYCLYAKGNLTYGLAIGSAQTGNTNGTAITNMTYANDSDYRDEWILDRIKLNYINYYDSSFANSSGLVSKILGANTFAGKAFTDQFGLTIGTISTSRKYDILCDQCTTGTDVECDDDICGDSCGDDHHKNYHRISDQLYDPLLQNTVVCLWTNRENGTFCYVSSDTGEHKVLSDVVIAAVSEFGRPVIQFFHVEPTNNDTAEYIMGLNLIHETAHAFGLHEQYRPPTYEDPNPFYSTHSSLYQMLNGFTCIMMQYDDEDAEMFYNLIWSGEEAFCAGCSNALSVLIDDLMQ